MLQKQINPEISVAQPNAILFFDHISSSPVWLSLTPWLRDSASFHIVDSPSQNPLLPGTQAGVVKGGEEGTPPLHRS